MITTPASDSVVKTEAFTSHVVGMETTFSAVMQMVTSMMESPMFSAMEPMASCILCSSHIV